MPTILASFATIDQAQKAKAALQESGFNVVQIDTLSRYPTEASSLLEQGFPNTLTRIPDPDVRRLEASDTSFSGWAAGDHLAGGQGVLLTVVTDTDEDKDEAASLIRSYGGRI